MAIRHGLELVLE